MIQKRSIPVRYPFTAFFLLLLIVFGTSDPLPGGDISSFSANPTPLELKYQQAKDYYYRLRRDASIRDNRQKWLSGVSVFRQIYLEHPKSEFAPRCLFMMGTMQYRMFLRFHQSNDLDGAVTYYSDVWQLFPRNTLADDAMYWTAEIHRKHKQDRRRAAELYARQINRYPDGDKYAEALNRLRELDNDHDLAPGEKLVPASVADEPVKVLPVQYWSSDDYTRIVIRSSGPVSYRSKLLTPKAGQPRKLLLDFDHSAIEKQYTVPVKVDDGLLRQIHSRQKDPDTVRIALELLSISNYKIFSLNDPFRVIVDVHGQQKVLTSSKTPPRLHQEQVESPRQSGSPAKKFTDMLQKQKPAPVLSEKKDDAYIVLKERKKRRPGGGSPEPANIRGELSLAQQLGLGVRRIVIDPGHGGKDPGAMGSGLKEKDITLNVARKMSRILQTHYNYEVILTRDDDRYLPLEERTAIANTRKADLFVSIHVNAHPDSSTRGVETFFLNLATNTEAMRVAAQENATTSLNISDMQDILTGLMQNAKIQESSVLAEYIQNTLVNGLQEDSYPTPDLGVKQAPFYVLIGAEMPSVLAEISFLSNPADADRLRQERYLNAVARQIAAGIAGYVDHQATAALRL